MATKIQFGRGDRIAVCKHNPLAAAALVKICSLLRVGRRINEPGVIENPIGEAVPFNERDLVTDAFRWKRIILYLAVFKRQFQTETIQRMRDAPERVQPGIGVERMCFDRFV